MLASVLTTNLAILVLAGFIGFVVISKVPNTLHTPLMSGTNAIHGIVILGGLLLIGLSGNGAFNKVILVIAIVFGTINVVGGFDVVITTALVPGRPAPKLVTAAAVEGMKAGSVIVDLAGEAGGNCELTEPGQTVVRHQVKIVSPLNLPSSMAEHSSQLFARNVQALLELFVGEDGALALDWEDEIVKGACVVKDGAIVNEGAKAAVEAAA